MQIEEYNNTELLSNQEAADFLKINVRTLNNWRCNNSTIIPFVKIGRRVVYKKSNLISYINLNTFKLSA